MSDLEPVFMTALRDRADGDVRVEPLLDGARRRGVRHRRNRRLAAIGGSAGAVAAVLAATLLVPTGGGTPPPATSAAPSARASTARPSPTPSERPRPPAVPGLAPLTAGGTLGQGRQLHLDTTDATPFTIRWDSADGFEALEVGRYPTSRFGYDLFRVMAYTTGPALDAAIAERQPNWPGKAAVEQLSAGGRPATLKWTNDWATLRWQPLDGVWALAEVKFHRMQPDPMPVIGAAEARDAMLEVAASIRYDRVLSCAAQYRLTWAPPGTRVRSCMVELPGSSTTTSLGFEVPGGGVFFVTDSTTDEVKPNKTYDGHPVEEGRDGSQIAIDGHQYTIERGDAGLSRDSLLRTLVGIRPGPATADPLA
ncbi:MAG TPA: hypothetical protein VL738_07465 [Dactylosporangium sp.]|nr:hypothetical protein [Dactylosporangium sp.]